MKKITIYLLSLAFISSAFAQVDRTKAPEAGPAPVIQIGKPQTFELKNGLKVFVVENHKIPRVAFSIVFDHEPVMEKDKAGYVDMVGDMLRRGTTTRSKEQLDQEIDFIGASLNAGANSVYGASLTKHEDKLLELMTDVMFNPVFPEEELEKIKTQTISGLAADKDDPNSISNNLATALTYGKDHPYGELTTEETVKNISVDDIKNYYQTYFKPNIAYMAIVGDIDKKEAQKLVKKYFSKWEAAEVPKPVYETPKAPEKTIVAISDKPSAVQSVIDITYPVDLKIGTPDVINARVLNQILGGGFSSRLMQNLREDKAYTYGARSSLSSDELVGDFSASASVRNDVTDSAVYQFVYELDRIRKENVTDEELNQAKSSINGSFARSLERPQTIANFAINTARYNLPEDYYSNYLKNVQAVTAEDVKATAQKYILPDHAYFTVVGKASEIADKLKPFGEIKYYDIYGNEYTPSDAPAIPAGLTAEKVIDTYIEAIGGKDKLESVKSIKTTSEAEIQGQKLQITSTKKAPNKSLALVTMGGVMELNKRIFDGKNLSVYGQGQKMESSAKDVQDASINALIFPELNYARNGVTVKLGNVEKVGDSYAYAVDVVLPSGTKQTSYYDTKTGLKVREVNYVTTPQGEVAQKVDYKDYGDESGILLPHTIIIPLGGPMTMEAKVISVEVNKPVDDGLFKTE
ncbi:MAG: insulinase family protein [Cyclobacteriaceae bacterium]|nr:insulinase family protein [Cyclobacteriaceae bacterium]